MTSRILIRLRDQTLKELAGLGQDRIVDVKSQTTETRAVVDQNQEYEVDQLVTFVLHLGGVRHSGLKGKRTREESL